MSPSLSMQLFHVAGLEMLIRGGNCSPSECWTLPQWTSPLFQPIVNVARPSPNTQLELVPSYTQTLK